MNEQMQKGLNKFLSNLLSIAIYGVMFLVLLSYADPSLSYRQVLCYSIILGFFAAIINNIERVLRELFDKKE